MNVQIDVNVITFMAHNLQTSYDLIKATLLELFMNWNEWSTKIEDGLFNLCAMETP